MSTDLTKSTFDILTEFQSCNISIVFNDEEQVPLLSISYTANLYEITYLQANTIETHEGVESAISAIIKELDT
ncbi:hypothetical protein [Sporosarcina sp. Te-1]|uniref:hypothetical protein n=1 Tax=Sporosarcina sp. Te-1 TaxID=2818390 RepID=UPI001A9F0C94|nr:hypothetical protein [Sporosarcina sp. Te-1]QTD42210.1 hypothetical protein J3U78_05130 [Sporosarcina sp. Te-1]